MMQKVKEYFLLILCFVVFSVLGIAVGYGAGFVVVILDNEGLFSSWKLLDSPMQFTEIVNATSQIVWARTTDENFFFWDFNCHRVPACNTWTEASEIPENARLGGEAPMSKNKTCESLVTKFFRQLPGNVVECARGSLSGPEFGVIAYYALTSDGKIWAWESDSSMIVNAVMPIFCSFLGLPLGMFAFFVFILSRKSHEDANQLAEN